jgi:hypothetical protein
MSQRGRDTYYLELLLAVFSARLAFICFSRWITGSDIILGTPFGMVAPLWVWGLLWTLSAAGLLYGLFGKPLRVIEYSAMFTAVLWLQAIYWTSQMNSVLTLRLGWAIIISLFSVWVYFYHARVVHSSRLYRNGNARFGK